AAVLGALTINSDVNQWEATGRVQHLAQLNGDVVKLSQTLEDELNWSAGFAATRQTPANGTFATKLKTAQNATDNAASAVLNDSTDTAEQQNYSNTVSGAQVDVAASNEILAEQMATTGANTPLNTQLKPDNWNADMTLTIQDTQKVANQLTQAITSRANVLRS